MPKTLPLYSISQTINTYRYLFELNSEFGTNLSVDNFETKDVVLLNDIKGGSQGVPIHFDFYVLFLRLKGKTIRTVNQFEYIIEEQSLQLVNPDSIYSFKDITDVSQTYVLLFDKKFIEKENLTSNIQNSLLDFHKKYPKDVVLNITHYAQVISIYEKLSYELRVKKEDYKIVAKMLINQLLYILKREKLNTELKQNLTRAQQISSEFLLLIEEHYRTRKKVKEYASLLDITPKHLSETIQSTLHHSAHSYINIRIIKESQYLLCFSDKSIKQITYILNFETLSQFGRFFKRHEGMSPRRYRLINKVLPAVITRHNN